MRSSEMHFCHVAQHLCSVHFHQLFRDLFDVRGHSSIESQSKLLPVALQPIDEAVARQNRCRSHRNIRFRFRALFDVDLPSMPQQRLLDDPRIGELIRQ